MQCKVQFNLQFLGENKTGYRAENMTYVSTDETSRKAHICLHCFFIPYGKSTAMQSNASSLPISYKFHVRLLLVNVMFPSEFRQ